MKRWPHAVRQCVRALALLGIAAGVIAAWLYSARVPTVAAMRAAYVPSDAWLLDRHGEVLDSRRIRMDVRRLAWTPLAGISPAFVVALTSGEDRRFATHSGVDWESMAGAVRDELWFGRRRGASTITMQLARLLRPAPRAHGVAAFAEKLGQIRMALALERHWSKHDILEAYVNLLGYQGDVQGIAAATARLLDKGPEALTRDESVALAALLPDPDAPRATLERRACARGRALEPQATCAGITLAVDALLARHVPMGNDAHLAPQLAHRLLTVPGERRVTTLDARLQALAVKSVSERLAVLSARNVRDGAAIVVDNATGEVLAYVGSAGLNSRLREVDGVQALRQAGSTLKPFLYELALERRYLTAASLLDDAPLSLDTASGVYIPQDYEHDFKGPVSVRTALAGSLNIPAVRTLVLVGIDPFLERLRALGYADVRQDANFYGFALALGSAEVSLWQQAAAYRALASDGIARPLTLAPASAPHESGAVRPVLAKDASFVIGDILADPQARAITFGLDNQLKTPHWSAAKTGTSEDMRDNWCIGFSARYTVAVWVGNFEGDSMHEVSGVSGAAPIWHDLMVALDSTADVSPTPPLSVESRAVRFTPRVESERHEWFLRGADAGYATVGQADTVVQDGGQPAIQSPANGVVIALDPDIPEASQKVLLAAGSADASMRLKLNDIDLGAAAKPHLWTPKAGAYRLTLEDANGRAVDRVLFTVRGGGT